MKSIFSDLEIACFLYVTWLVVVKLFKGFEATDRNSTAITKYKMFIKAPTTIRTPKFVWKGQKIIIKNPRKSIRAITEELKSGHFMCAKAKDNCLICTKHLASKLKHQEPGMLSFFSDEKTLIRTKRLTEWMTNGYAETLRTFQWSCTQDFKQLWWFWKMWTMKEMPCFHTSFWGCKGQCCRL